LIRYDRAVTGNSNQAERIFGTTKLIIREFEIAAMPTPYAPPR
jgi:hypothetical protein